MRVASMRRRMSASCSSGTSTRNGRTVAALAVTDMRAPPFPDDTRTLAVVHPRRAREVPGPLPGFLRLRHVQHDLAGRAAAVDQLERLGCLVEREAVAH